MAKSRRQKRAEPTVVFSLYELVQMDDELHSPRADYLNQEVLWKLHNLVGREFMRHKWTKQEKDWFRHKMVCESLDAGKGWEGSHEDASSKVPKDHPAWGEPPTMEAGYKAHEQTLPPEHRRPLTRRPKTPVG
jgi:hypothetical protein